MENDDLGSVEKETSAVGHSTSINEETTGVGSSGAIGEETPADESFGPINEETAGVGSSAFLNKDEWALIGDSFPWWNGNLWPLLPLGDQSAASFIPTSIRAFCIPGVRINSSALPDFGPLLTYLGIASETVVSQFNRATLFGYGYKKLIVFGGGNDILLGPCRNDCYYADNPNDKSGEYCADPEALPSFECQSVIENAMHDFQTLIVDRASERGVTNIIHVTYPQVPDWSDGDCSSCDELCLGWPINKCLRENECGSFGTKTTAALHYTRNKIRGMNTRGINYQLVELKKDFLDASGNPDKTLFDRCDGFNGIHPSVKGSKRMAEAIWAAMQNPHGNNSCDDGVRNGDEEGMDCGGSCPEQCEAVPSCDDGIQNGDEADVDCGGSCPEDCAACTGDGDCSGGQFCNWITARCEEKVPDGSLCLHDGACQSGHCRAGFCVQCTGDAHCGAGEYCGLVTASCRPDKPNGSLCRHDGACQSGHCRAGFCVQCTKDSHCNDNKFCSVLPASCKDKKSNDSICTRNRECASNNCKLTFLGPRCR